MPLLLTVVSAHTRRPPTLDCHQQQSCSASWTCSINTERLLFSTAGEDGGSATQKEIRKETQDPSSVGAAAFRALGVQPQGPQPIRLPQLRRRTLLTGNAQREYDGGFNSETLHLLITFSLCRSIQVPQRQKRRTIQMVAMRSGGRPAVSTTL